MLRNRSVLGIGLGSLLSDTGHEMATAALPGFLSSIGVQAAALGAIEGIADASMSASRVVGGVIADRPNVERKTDANRHVSSYPRTERHSSEPPPLRQIRRSVVAARP